MTEFYELQTEVQGTSHTGETYVSRVRVAKCRTTEHPSLLTARPQPRLERPSGGPRIGKRSSAAKPQQRNQKPMAKEGSVPGQRWLPLPSGTVFEKAYPDPGCYVRVQCARLRNELAQQLHDFEQLEANQLIDCILQVYRIHRPVSLGRLRSLMRSDDTRGMELIRLTARAASVFGLPAPPETKPVDVDTPGIAHPGEWYWSIDAVSDPTRPIQTPAPSKEDTGSS